MGWSIDKTYENNPAQDGEKWNTFELHVTGNSCSDTICFDCKGQSIQMEASLLLRIMKDLEQRGFD